MESSPRQEEPSISLRRGSAALGRLLLLLQPVPLPSPSLGQEMPLRACAVAREGGPRGEPTASRCHRPGETAWVSRCPCACPLLGPWASGSCGGKEMDGRPPCRPGESDSMVQKCPEQQAELEQAACLHCLAPGSGYRVWSVCSHSVCHLLQTGLRLVGNHSTGGCFSWWCLCLWYFVCCFWATSVNSILVSPAAPSSCVPYLHVDFANPVFRRRTEVPVSQVPAVPRAPGPVLLTVWLHRQTLSSEQQCSWNGVWPVRPVPACQHSWARVGPAEARSQQLSHLPWHV